MVTHLTPQKGMVQFLPWRVHGIKIQNPSLPFIFATLTGLTFLIQTVQIFLLTHFINP